MKKPAFGTLFMAVVVILGPGTALRASPIGDRIESSARKSYVFVTYLKDADIKIHTGKDSVVTLTGEVAEWSHRSLAEETVAGVPGVKHVDNKLKSRGGQPVENSDAWINMKVKTLLLLRRNVSGLATDVAVKEGVVTLRGPASSEAQKELTTEYAMDVDGVAKVANEMIVAKAGKSAVEKVGDYVDDASITAQVRLALLFHRSTSAIKTSVETRGGIVTVGGVARNDAEKELVGKLVNDVKGVKGLKNEMTVG